MQPIFARQILNSKWLLFSKTLFLFDSKNPPYDNIPFKYLGPPQIQREGPARRAQFWERAFVD